jgi:tRNA (guanine37-N1)-methyltransferase
MVMKAEPVFEAVESIHSKESHVILLSPQGVTFSQSKARELAGYAHLILVCGHYEGVDERVRLGIIDEEISIGDYVLTNGNLPSMVVVDAVVRLLPGVLGSEKSIVEESFSQNLLEYPQYTRPLAYKDMTVPEVLLSGNHAEIRSWRSEQAIKRTNERRPDLMW